jgi:hypothetical protein
MFCEYEAMSKNDLSFQQAQTADQTGHGGTPAADFFEIPERISREVLLLVGFGREMF